LGLSQWFIDSCGKLFASTPPCVIKVESLFEVSYSDGSEYEDDGFLGYITMLSHRNIISEMHTASIIALMMEAICTSETLVYFKRLHDAVFQKAVIFRCSFCF
jgi:hypothetical protein